MNVLFIGGTGTISTDVVKRIARRSNYAHLNLFLLNRGNANTKLPPEVLQNVTLLEGNIYDPDSVRRVIGDRVWDCVVDWIGFTPENVANDLNLFRDNCKQFIFISSASAYQKPITKLPITESTPLVNPYWEYSRNKIACEEALMKAHRDTGFPVTIVRPSHTYSDRNLPTAYCPGNQPWTIVNRMLTGQPVIIPGDGTALWTLTHASDFARGFAGLIGHPQSIGHTFHITHDDSLSWNMIYETLADAVGVRKPEFVHVASETISEHDPDARGGLIGDKSANVLFDNSKIKSFVPEFECVVPWHIGVRRVIAWHMANPEAQQISSKADAMMNRILGV